ncbi:MAG: oligosaccharide flippase family protein [Clostridium celatum]|nr:oligosaccharide flippase family protein [Clostridium celatum]
MDNINNKKNIDLFKGMIIYAIGNFGTKILSFLIVPLYTYYITAEDMGTYDLLITTVNLLSPIITLQISDAAYSWMMREKEIEDICIKSTFQILIFNTIVSTLVIVGVNQIYPIPYCMEFIFVLASSNALAIAQKLLRGVKNQKLFATSGIIYTFIFLSLNVIQICILKLGVRSLFTSAIIANILTLVIILILEKRLRTSLIDKVDLNLSKKMLSFSTPLIANQLSWWVINSSDRYIITFFLGKAANGIFSIAYKFPSILQIILNLFNTAWQDVSIVDDDVDQGTYYSEVFKQLYRVSFMLLLPLIPITKIVINLIVEDSYKSASNYISFLYLATIFQSFSSFYGVGYLKSKHTKQASLTSIYGAVVNAVVNLALIKLIGLQAAAISTFFGFFIMWLIREKQNRKALGININMGDFTKFFIPTLIFCIVVCFTNIYIDIILFIFGIFIFVYCNINYVYDLLGYFIPGLKRK